MPQQTFHSAHCHTSGSNPHYRHGKGDTHTLPRKAQPTTNHNKPFIPREMAILNVAFLTSQSRTRPRNIEAERTIRDMHLGEETAKAPTLFPPLTGRRKDAGHQSEKRQL
ncbi:hypothetical protein E2C01_083018 [Portunus trituberculatus]|uniref:Uncharacterized protein n=1 Tax=Portunus trituberculatus TaxID=210409 RepID=A0A5B7J009_PORTR|nr:hypothetical protein [Portunus trituberculatus]